MAARLSAPPPQIDAAQHDLAIAPGQAANLIHNLFHRSAAAAAAHEGDDTKRTAVIASVLNLQVGPGAVASRVLHRRREEVVLREDVAHMDIAVVGCAGGQARVSAS